MSSIPHDQRDEVNIKPNELVVSTVANRPHNKLLENDLRLCEYLDDLKLSDLGDVGASALPEHSDMPSGDQTAGGEISPTVLVRKNGESLFNSDTINEDTVNILRPTLNGGGSLRVSPGSWHSYADSLKQFVNRVKTDVAITQLPDQNRTAPFVEYLVAENNNTELTAYNSKPEALAGLGFYVGWGTVEYNGTANIYTSFTDERTFTPTLSPGVEVVDNKYDFTVLPWSEEFEVAASGSNQTFTTTDPEHQYQFGNLLQVYLNGDNLILNEDYEEVNQTSVKIFNTLSAGDVVKLSNLVGIQDVTYNLPDGTYSPSYTQKDLATEITAGSTDSVGFAYEPGLGWMAVFIDGEKATPGVDYVESDNFNVLWNITLPAGTLVEYHYAVGFTGLVSQEEESSHPLNAGLASFSVPGLTDQQDVKLFMSGILVRDDQYTRSGTVISLNTPVVEDVIMTVFRITTANADSVVGTELDGLTYKPLTTPVMDTISQIGNTSVTSNIDVESLVGSAIPSNADYVKVRYSISVDPVGSNENFETTLYSWAGGTSSVTLLTPPYAVAGVNVKSSENGKDFSTQVVPINKSNNNNVSFGWAFDGNPASSLTTTVQYWIEGYYLAENTLEQEIVNDTDGKTAFAAVTGAGGVISFANCSVSRVAVGRYDIEVTSATPPTLSRSAAVATLHNTSSIAYGDTFNQPGIYEIQVGQLNPTTFRVSTYKTSGTLQSNGQGNDGNHSVRSSKVYIDHEFNVQVKWQ